MISLGKIEKGSPYIVSGVYLVNFSCFLLVSRIRGISTGGPALVSPLNGGFPYLNASGRKH
jgi:hypothetical protein